MQIRLGYDIQFEIPQRVSILTMLYVHPSREHDLREPDVMHVEPEIEVTGYLDSFGNRVGRLVAPEGLLRLHGSCLIDDSGQPDPIHPELIAHPIEDLPHEVLQFLINSRYCEVDRLGAIAFELFGHIPAGWARVQAICDWVHEKVRFGYPFARSSKTALDVFTERTGVCRDFQHLAVTFCRTLDIPARYVTGYLGDIGIPPRGPMDFSAWFQVFLDGQWWDFDARNNMPRIGRVLMAVGRDASDVAITTSFGAANLKSFEVISKIEVD